MEKFSAKLRELGVDQVTIGFGPDKEVFQNMIAEAGLNFLLNRIPKRAAKRD
jgi:hypothetical protein